MRRQRPGQAREKIATLFAAGERKVLIGMAGVTVLDSSGVGELVAALNAAKSAGAEIKLSPRVGEVLKITQLTGVFEIFDSLEEGLSSFS